MNWDILDFIAFGLLLFLGVCLVYIVKRSVKNRKNLGVLFIVVVLFLLLLWAEMAVGIFGTPLAGN